MDTGALPKPDVEPKADGLLEQYQSWYRNDMPKVRMWRKEALESFKFRDGDQWTPEEIQYLKDQDRVPVTFNRTGVLVDAVAGQESNNRRETRYIGRDMQDAKPNELLTSAAEWFRDQTGAEHEESAAFKDTVTAGMGWIETRIDRENNPAGDPKIDQIDPFEMGWDCNAQKSNLGDAERLWRVKQVDLEVAQRLFPGMEAEDLNGAWADEETESEEPTRNRPKYTNEIRQDDTLSRKVTLVALQYCVREPYYKALILTPPAMQPQMVELDEAKFKIAQKSGAVLQSAKLVRKVVKQVFIGAKVLKAPTPTQTGDFTWRCITGLKDTDKGIYYGIVRRAKDPQRWANKWLMQMKHILDSQAKGGIMAERDAFEDQRQADESWARADRITWVNNGAVAHGKIQPKPTAAFPAGFDRLLQYADEMIIKATGINMELLGMREVNQPGVLEYQRKQSGISILAPFFDSLKLYRLMQGKTMLKLIQNHLADGRLVRILGQDNARYVPLLKENIANIEYDIIVDDAPTSTNEKEKTWQIIQPMLPLLKDMLGPEEMMLIAQYTPLPTSFVDKMKELQQSKQQKPDTQAQMQQMAMQVEQGKAMLEMEKLKVEMAKIQADREKTAMEAQQMGIDLELGFMEQQTERQRLGVDQIEAYAALEAARNPAPVAQSKLN